MGKHWVLEGPPFGQFVDPDEAYVRGQGSQVGSGLLGGWSQANFGGFFEVEEPPGREIREEIHELVARDERRWPVATADSTSGTAGKP